VQRPLFKRISRKLAYWRVNASPSRFDLDLLVEQPECQPAPGSDIAVFNHFDPDGSVAEHVLWHLDRLKEAGFAVVFVSTSPCLSPNAVHALRSRCWILGTRRNLGMDIGGWPCAVKAIETLTRRPLSTFRRLLITNDSVFGPLRSLPELLEIMGSRNLDIWGNSDSNEGGHHLQSYFLVFEQPALGFFREWVRRMKLIEDREAVIMRYELGLGHAARDAGLQFGALVSCDALLAHVERSGAVSDKLAARLLVRPGYFNPTHDFWRETIDPFGSAYIKRDLLRRLRSQGDAYTQAREWLSVKVQYPVSLIDEYFSGT